jgi:hypothetical protein
MIVTLLVGSVDRGTPIVIRDLATTRLDTFLDMYETEDDALAAVTMS